MSSYISACRAVVDRQALGGGGGLPFRNQNESRVRLMRFYGNQPVRGVHVEYYDGSVFDAGSAEGDVTNVHLGADEYLTRTFIGYTDYRGGRVAFVKVATSKNNTYSTDGNMDMDHATDQDVDAVVGWLIGFYGRSGADLDQLGLIMDLVPNAYAMSNVKYDTANAQIKLGAPQYGSKQTISRTKGSDTSSPVTESVVVQHTSTVSRNWSKSLGLKVGVKTSIACGVPLLADGKVEISVETSYNYSWGEIQTDTTTTGTTVQVTLPAGVATVTAMSVVTSATMDVPYVADIVAFFEGGRTATFTGVRGVFTGVAVTNVDTVVGNA